MKTGIYKIDALTNMHVGSGDAGYGVIDNLVQRDAVTELPTINGSSLKGALKEFFENKWGEKDARLKSIFGDNDRNADYRFLCANLLAIPVRSNKKNYFLATAPGLIKSLEEDCKNFGLEIDLNAFEGLKPEVRKPIVFTNTHDLLIEDYESFKQVDKSGNNPVFGDFEKLIILNDKDFKELCSDTGLPVIARNKVGENKNLWYEQIVPHKSLFSFVLLHNDQNIQDFNKELFDEGSIVHIGANATVGYGYTKISKLV
jgi:CRISPR-associated protein Cmr4